MFRDSGCPIKTDPTGPTGPFCAATPCPT
jgi:hypothetical protein